MTFAPRFFLDDLELSREPFMVLQQTADLGAPQNMVELLDSMLPDGSLEISERAENRTMSLTVYTEGSNLLTVSKADALLAVQCDKQRSVFVIDPGDGYGPPTAFDVVSKVDATVVRSEDAEAMGLRQIDLTWRALPYGRSTTLVTDDALTPSSTVAIADPCESTSGWSTPDYGSAYAYPPTGLGPAAPAVDSSVKFSGTGSVRVEASVFGWKTVYGVDYTAEQFEPKKTGLSIATGTGGYLTFAVKVDAPGAPDLGSFAPQGMNPNGAYVTYATAGRKNVSPVAYGALDTNGWVLYTVPMLASDTVTALEFKYSAYQEGTRGRTHLWVDQVGTSAAATSDSQIVKVLDVKGSARAPGSLHVSAPSDSVALSQVLVITASGEDVLDGFAPDVKRWVTASPTPTTDATALHGTKVTTPGSPGSSLEYQVPVSISKPGRYSVVSLSKSGSAAIFAGLEARLLMGGTATGDALSVETTVDNSGSLTSAWRFLKLGSLTLPPSEVRNPDATAKVRLRPYGGADLAELFLIPEDACWSAVDCGSGTVSASGASSHLWIDSPDAAQPYGGWWRGPVDGRVNARRLTNVTDLIQPGRHVFKPGRLVCWLVSTGAAGPRLGLSYFPHAHTFSAD